MSTCTLDNIKTIITNVYAPNNDNEKVNYFLQLLNIIKDKVRNRDEYTLLCGGDFNTVKNNDMDIISGLPHCKDTVKMFNTFINELLLTDAWRWLHPLKKMYSWKRANIARRLDYILTDELLTSNLQNSVIETVGFSDHLMVSIEIKSSNFRYGKSYYKMNTSILLNQKYIDIMKKEIPKMIDNHSTLDPHLHWEMVKAEIRELTQKFCRNNSVNKNNEKQLIMKELVTLEQKLSKNPSDENLTAEHNLKKKRYEEIIEEEVRGIRIRCGLKWIEEGERNTKFFLSLEKRRSAQNTIKELEVGDTKIIDEGEILTEIGQYYEDLYMQKESNNTIDFDKNLEFFISDLIIPCLDNDQKENCDEEFNLEDMAEAVKDMKNGSSPGIDGIPIEFYKIFFNQIKVVLFNCFIFSLEKGELTTTQNRGVLSLLHKGKGLSRNKLDNWRPLSLTNSDYKILAKMVAKRVQKVLKVIIDKDQCGFVKGRDVSVLLREIDDLIENERNTHTEHILLAIDYRKAFDTISSEFIHRCLTLFGFGPYIREWVKVILNGRTFCVKNGGHLSKYYEMTRGVRQGCPLSPLIFIIAIELLGIKIRQAENIKGIRIENCNVVHKIKQFADDTTFLLNDIIDFREVLSKIKEFSNISGLEMNKNKTFAFNISTFSANIDEYDGIKFVDKVKLLGIWYSRACAAREMKENWEGKIERLERILAMWSRHRLTMMGKVLVIKVFGLSLFIYAMKSIGLPQTVLQRVNRMFFSFIWKRNFKEGKTFERVKRKILCSEVDEGGLGMIDIHLMQDGFMIKWCLKLILEQKEKWAALPKKFFGKVGISNVFLCSTDKKEFKGLDTIKSNFWKEALVAWLTYSGAEALLKIEEINILEMPIFNNKSIVYQKKSIYLDETIQRGIFLVKDITSNGEMISFANFLLKFGSYPRAQLDYFILLNALKNKLNKEHNNNNNNTAKLEEKANTFLHMKNKQLRNVIEDKYKEVSCGRKLWERKFDRDISKLYTNSMNNIKEVKMRELLFKIYHNIYPTNIILQKIGIKVSNKCDFCQEVDFLDHSLIECYRLRLYWQKVLNFIEKETKLLIPDHPIHKLFGINEGMGKETNPQKANLLLIIAKFAIIKAKYYKKENIYGIFQSEIKFRKIIQ